MAQPGRPTRTGAPLGASHPRLAKVLANMGAFCTLARADASTTLVFLFVHAASGLPNALADAAITSCLAHRCSLFGILPAFQGRRYCTESGVCSQCNPAVVPTLPGPLFPQIHTREMGLRPYISWHCYSKIRPAGVLFKLQLHEQLSNIHENFNLVYFCKATQENMFHLAINTNMQDSILSTKFQANILHININFLHSVI